LVEPDLPLEKPKGPAWSPTHQNIAPPLFWYLKLAKPECS